MANRIQLRRDTAANWTRVNPILEDGEPGLEIDSNRVKYGDGNTVWNSLDYASGGLTDVDGVVAFPGDLLIGTLWPDGFDKESVVWAKNDTEYLGLWWGGDQIYPEPYYGPVAGIMIGAYDSMTDDFTGNASPVDTTITIAINNSLGDTLSWVFDRDGNLTLPDYGGDILTNGGDNSAIHDLIQHDVHTDAASYSLVLSDRGKMIYQTGGYTVIVPTNGQVAFPIGSVITIVNSGGAGDLDIVSFDIGVNTDIYGAGTDITSTDWALPSNSIATLIKVETNGAYSKWLLSGVGIYDNS
ncbi:hypothetical protein UFOVP29_105 [uncultured Caudovirales phage]|uniref:Major tropism determinant N-terminal domain-containing protein n=1 Tax=uncultured Caudovirales phage TaxID=2100421 RepID=A0A6J5KNV7_9CAUD|nr:hypothetical protein UFOVP29_105 [uncultured Caudovirales phage]